jgi:hypothetical protein
MEQCENLGVDLESIGYCFLFGCEFLWCYACILMGSQRFQVNLPIFPEHLFGLFFVLLGGHPLQAGFYAYFWHVVLVGVLYSW